MCECDTCQRLRYYKSVNVPEDVVEYILDLEMDIAYNKSILDGKWPNGKKLLEEALKKYDI